MGSKIKAMEMSVDRGKRGTKYHGNNFNYSNEEVPDQQYRIEDLSYIIELVPTIQQIGPAQQGQRQFWGVGKLLEFIQAVTT